MSCYICVRVQTTTQHPICEVRAVPFARDDGKGRGETHPEAWKRERRSSCEEEMNGLGAGADLGEGCGLDDVVFGEGEEEKGDS